jgi:peptidoglycan/LPS O-acetylase OafA/YrhL
VVRHLLLTQLPSYAAHFALGALIARGWLRVSERDFRHAAVASAAVATAAAVAIVVLLRFIVAPWGEHSWMLTTAALAALLAAAATGARWAVRLLGRGPLAFVGRISYSIYLYHLPVLLLWNLHGPTGLLSAPLYGIAIIAIGWLSWRFVEAPFRSAGLRGARARPDEERRPDGEALQQGHAP